MYERYSKGDFDLLWSPCAGLMRYRAANGLWFVLRHCTRAPLTRQLDTDHTPSHHPQYKTTAFCFGHLLSRIKIEVLTEILVMLDPLNNHVQHIKTDPTLRLY